MRLLHHLFPWLAALAVYAACGCAAQAAALFLQANVVCQGRPVLPVRAENEIIPADDSPAGGRADIAAKTRFAPRIASPVALGLTSEPESIRLKQHDSEQVRIAAGERLAFIPAARRPLSAGAQDNAQATAGSVSASENSVRGTHLAGTWTVTRISGKAVTGAKPPEVEITSAGRVSGHSGCNGFGGTLGIHRGKARFSPMVATQMACRQPLMRQEHALYEAFSRAEQYELGPKGVKFLDHKGRTVLVFIRK